MASIAPFSFHCTICYEAFDCTDHPPVVLPCGHTYVCAQCSKRLKKCMECRASLFLTPPPAATKPSLAPLQSARTSRVMPQKPSAAAEPVPLPMPKNLVMLALMGAAEAERAARRRAERERAGRRKGEEGKEKASGASLLAGGASGGTDDSTRESEESTEVGLSMTLSSASLEGPVKEENEDDGRRSSKSSSELAYESGDDDSAVWAGAVSLTAPYGTYAVREKVGLIVHPQHPHKEGETKYSPVDLEDGAGYSCHSNSAESCSKQSTSHHDSDGLVETGCNGNGNGASNYHDEELRTGKQQEDQDDKYRSAEQQQNQSKDDQHTKELGKVQEEDPQCMEQRMVKQPTDRQGGTEQQEEDKHKGLKEQQRAQDEERKEADQPQGHQEDRDQDTEHNLAHRDDEQRDVEQVWQKNAPPQNLAQLQQQQESYDEMRDVEQIWMEEKKRDQKQPQGEDGRKEVAESREYEPFWIEYGQTVQVVDVSDGVATLARGRGFVVASSNQLVKVGAPLDKACHIEGMLRSVVSKKKEYEKKLRKTVQLLSSLENDLKGALSSTEDQHPVISPLPLPEEEPDQFCGEDDAKENQERSKSSQQIRTVSSSSPTFGAEASPTVVPRTPDPYSHSTPNPGRSSRYADSPFTIDNSELDPSQSHDYSRAITNLIHDDSHPGLIALGCPFIGNSGRYLSESGEEVNTFRGISFDSAFGSAIDTGTNRLGGSRSFSRTQSQSDADRPDNRDPVAGGRGNGAEGTPMRPTLSSSSGMSGGSTAAGGRGMRGGGRRRLEPASGLPLVPAMNHGRHPHGDYHPATIGGTIDYRTGFSCHRGIGPSKAKSDLITAQAHAARGEVRMMGEHRGIGTIRSIRPRQGGVTGSP